jgi:hypothetical protein
MAQDDISVSEEHRDKQQTPKILLAAKLLESKRLKNKVIISHS